MVNAHIIYCSCTPAPHKSLKVFVQDVVTGLLEGYSRKESHKGRKKSLGEMPQRLTECHFLYRLMTTQIVSYVLIEPGLKAAVRQNTGVGSMG